MDQAPFAGFRATVCGIDELDGLAGAGVTHVLSLLNPGWPAPERLEALGAVRRLDLRFHDIVDALPGLRPPTPGDVATLLEFARPLDGAAPTHVLVHCEKGLSRSTAALALVLAQAHPAVAGAEIIAEIVRLRPRAWPNLRIVELGDAMLGRGGTLVAAAAARYRARIAEVPRLADAMIEMGRARELTLAFGY